MTAATSQTIVRGEEALAAFRQGLTGARALELLEGAGGRLLVQLPVGVGKTQWMVKILIHVLEVSFHDLIVVLVPRWDILQELLDRLPATVSRIVLRPRPRSRCGALDPSWEEYEQHGCGALGRRRLCGACPRRKGCPWPGQYSNGLRGARLVLATQQHLVLNPSFLLHLTQQTRASRPLLLLDESDLLIRSAERTLAAVDLEHFVSAQESLASSAGKLTHAQREWLEISRLLIEAPTADLRGGDWSLPRVDNQWAADIQQRGRELFGPSFRFLGHDLSHFAYSDPGARERLPGGELRYAVLPYLGRSFIIFSGSMARELARYRLDPDHDRPALVSPFDDHRFNHPATSWFNLNSLTGAAQFFPANAGRIIDFFASLITRNITAGKRTLLVCRKKFVRLCRQLLLDSLAALGVNPVQIVTRDWGKHDLSDPRVLPLITYGIAGVNRFEHIDCAYCLNSYYVSPEVVSQAVQDIEASQERYPLRIVSSGQPRRRHMQVDLPDDRVPILPRIAELALQQKEGDVVVQAVGRVRPFTRAREIITFQAGELPGVHYTMEFTSLGAARKYFTVHTPVQAGLQARIEQAWRLRAQGFSRKQIAQAMGISISTTKRYLRCGRGHEASPYI